MDKRTPYNQLNGCDQISSITTMMQQAYFRRSKQLPANLAAMAEMLKGDILKYLGDIPVGVLDEAITTSTLGDTDTPLSLAFFFNAAKKAWYVPRTNRHTWEDNDHNQRNDFETDTIDLLDVCAAMLRRMDDRKDNGQQTLGDLICSSLPAFNARREYNYLVIRGQLAEDSYPHFLAHAIEEVNKDRLRENHNRVGRDTALKDPDVIAKCRRLAVLDWLRSCNTRGTTPSSILTPLINEQQYQKFMINN